MPAQTARLLFIRCCCNWLGQHPKSEVAAAAVVPCDHTQDSCLSLLRVCFGILARCGSIRNAFLAAARQCHSVRLQSAEQPLFARSGCLSGLFYKTQQGNPPCHHLARDRRLQRPVLNDRVDQAPLLGIWGIHVEVSVQRFGCAADTQRQQQQQRREQRPDLLLPCLSYTAEDVIRVSKHCACADSLKPQVVCCQLLRDTHAHTSEDRRATVRHCRQLSAHTLSLCSLKHAAGGLLSVDVLKSIPSQLSNRHTHTLTRFPAHSA